MTTTVPAAPLTKTNDKTAMARSSFIVFLFYRLAHAESADSIMLSKEVPPRRHINHTRIKNTKLQ